MNLLVSFLLKTATVVVFFLFGFILETFFPVSEDPANNQRFNLVYTILYKVFEITGISLLTYWVVASVRSAPFHELMSLGSDGGRLAVSLLLMLLSIALTDFFYYWMHRLLHSNPWMWAIHELHHSDENMNVTTAWRQHFLERPIQVLFTVAPMTLLFKPPAITVVSAVIMGEAFPYFIHLGARINIGPLERVFMNPHSHRVHHSKLPEHLDKNFAAAFSFWDVLFGTYYHASADEWPETGLASGETIQSLPQALALPFVRWRNLLASRRLR